MKTFQVSTEREREREGKKDVGELEGENDTCNVSPSYIIIGPSSFFITLINTYLLHSFEGVSAAGLGAHADWG
jgi:hypothetical protein